MSNSHINISNTIGIVKDGNFPNDSKKVTTFTSGTNTYTEIASCSINVNNNSAKVLIVIHIGLDHSATSTGSGFKFTRNGSDLTLGDVTGSRTSVFGNMARTNIPISGTYYYLDTGVSSGNYTYAISHQTSGSVTVGINRDAGTESSSTNRTLTTIMALEL